MYFAVGVALVIWVSKKEDWTEICEEQRLLSDNQNVAVMMFAFICAVLLWPTIIIVPIYEWITGDTVLEEFRD
jgi:hypothetical protein